MVTYYGKEVSVHTLLETIDNMQFTECFDLTDGWAINGKILDVKHLCEILA